jgi:hypothetical protein
MCRKTEDSTRSVKNDKFSKVAGYKSNSLFIYVNNNENKLKNKAIYNRIRKNQIHSNRFNQGSKRLKH